MNKVVLLMDIGGTNTRARIVSAEHTSYPDVEEIAFTQMKLSNKESLFDFLSELFNRYELENRIELAVLCFAGPLVNHTRVTMTNWTGDKSINCSELHACGLPSDTLMLNDMEAACYYLVSLRQIETNVKITNLHPGRNGKPHKEGNSVLMIPGTGLGTAAILFPEYSGSQSRPVIIGSEIQHACVATLDAADAPMLDKIASYMGRDRLSWEDIVSGRGLVNIFTYLTNEANANSSKVKSVPGLWAGEIAEHAVQKYDVNCISALNIYYRYAGALAQLLALCYQPLGGIYLAGESTSKNVSFIKQGHFLDELHHSATQREGLQSYPVYLIADEINLQGAAYLASLHLNSNEPKSFFA